MTRREDLAEGITLYLGDCREILPTLKRMDALVTDPPYGINATASRIATKGANGWRLYGDSDWDKERPAISIFHLMLEAAKKHIIWGGNYFTDILPPTMQWLIWDKGQRDFSLADFEMAWCSQNNAARIFDYARGKALQDGKEHPTQKPIELMKWCIELLNSPVDSILDPFMGSGTTGVAAAKLGKRFIGIEVETKYFDISCRRISEATKQPDMFIAPPEPIKQVAML